MAIFMDLERLAKSGRGERVYSGKTRNRNVRIVRKPLSRRSVKKVRSLLITALDEAVVFGKIARNEAKLTIIPATVPPEAKKSLTAPQAKAVLTAAEKDPLVHAFLLIGLIGGLRPEENLGAQGHRLDWNYFTDDDGQVYGALDIEKTLKVHGGYVRNGVRVPERREMGDVKGRIEASKRIMVLPPKVLKVLRRWEVTQKEHQLKTGQDWQNNEYNLIFTSRVGTPMNDNNLRRRMRNVLEDAGLEGWSINELTRHSFATLIEADLQPQILERAQGHAPGSNSSRNYIHREKPVITEHLAPMERILGGDDAH